MRRFVDDLVEGRENEVLAAVTIMKDAVMLDDGMIRFQGRTLGV